MLRGHGVDEVDVRGLLIDCHERPGFFDEGADGRRLHFALTHAREIDEAFADALQALRYALHTVEAVERWGVVGGLGHLLDGTGEDGEGRIELMRDGGGEEAEADEAVLLLQAAEGGGELILSIAEGGYGSITRAHDLADLVLGDLFGGDDFAKTVAGLGGGVGRKHAVEGQKGA